MTEHLPPSFLPSRFQVLSGSGLKLIAIITMLIDHTAAVLLSIYPPAMTPLFYIGDRGYSAYRLCRDIGRIAFPIFCFLLILFSADRGISSYAEPLEIWTESFSFCTDFRDSLELYVYRYVDLCKAECIFYIVSGISWILCHRAFPRCLLETVSLPSGPSFHLHKAERGLWMERIRLSFTYVSSQGREGNAGDCGKLLAFL